MAATAQGFGDSVRIKVAPHLIVGDLTEACPLYGPLPYETPPNTSIVHACKFPCHRSTLGYKSAPLKDDPEYLTAQRGRHLFLNLIDAPDPAYIPDELIFKALAFIALEIAEDRDVICHCNLGQSRAPGLALLYLARSEDLFAAYDEAKTRFRDRYPAFDPGKGVDAYLREHWPMKG